MNSKTRKQVMALVLFAALEFQLQPAAQAQDEAVGTADQASPQSDYTRPSVFWVAVSPLTPGTVSAGGSADSSVTAGFGTNGVGTAALTCSVQPLPPLAPTCSISAASLAFGKTAVLTVSTTGPSANLLSGPGSGLMYALSLPLIGLIATGLGRGSHKRGNKAKMKTTILLGALLVLGSFQIACGGSVPRTPAGTYTITVNGTAFVPVNSASALSTISVQ